MYRDACTQAYTDIGLHGHGCKRKTRDIITATLLSWQMKLLQRDAYNSDAYRERCYRDACTSMHGIGLVMHRHRDAYRGTLTNIEIPVLKCMDTGLHQYT